MVLLALGSLIVGILFGHFIFPQSVIASSDLFITWSMRVLVFSVGIDLGSNKTILRKMREYSLKILLIPVGIIVGSIIGGAVVSVFIDLTVNEATAITAGLGWYSLAGIILKDIGNAQLGTTAFLCNMFREIFSFLLIPILASKVNFLTALAPGGVTTMDTTISVVSKSTNQEVTIIGLISGIVCTIAIPILIPFLYTFL